MFRKGSVRKIGDTKVHAEDVKRKGTGTELKLRVTDPSGEGHVVLTIWAPNKKTRETTV